MPTCYHCAGQIAPAQRQLIHRPPGPQAWPIRAAGTWQAFHAQCYFDAERAAELALGLLPEGATA
jgi:hypothetical protein